MAGMAKPRRQAPARAAEPRSITTLQAALAVFLTFASPRMLAIQLVVALGIRPIFGPPGLGDLLIVAAVAIYWPLQEWFLHRYVLHMRPRELLGLRIDPIAARYHRAHHREPWRLEYVFLPGRMIVAMIPAHVALWLWLAPSHALALTGIAAFGGAALFYEWIHYLTHTFYRPRSAYYREIWRGHRLHHFKNERYWYGFTVPLVDRLLGTAPDPGSVPNSETCATLGIDD